MLVKLGVSIERLKRPARRALSKVDYVFRGHEEEVVITSTFEGDHSPSSLHYADLAFDIRKPKKPITRVITQIRSILGVSYDVVDERDHYHIEYDPKGKV